MAIGVSNARFEVAGITVDLGSHQWGCTDGARWLIRDIGETPYGLHYWGVYSISVRHREVRFVKDDALIEQFRRLTIRAGQTGLPVKFTPDLDSPGTFWMLDWKLEETFDRVVDNREEITILLQEQSAGV
jgi:hypothetical protein